MISPGCAPERGLTLCAAGLRFVPDSKKEKGIAMRVPKCLSTPIAALALALLAASPAVAQAPAKKPNILFIMGDDKRAGHHNPSQ